MRQTKQDCMRLTSSFFILPFMWRYWNHNLLFLLKDRFSITFLTVLSWLLVVSDFWVLPSCLLVEIQLMQKTSSFEFTYTYICPLCLLNGIIETNKKQYNSALKAIITQCLMLTVAPGWLSWSSHKFHEEGAYFLMNLFLISPC